MSFHVFVSQENEKEISTARYMKRWHGQQSQAISALQFAFVISGFHATFWTRVDDSCDEATEIIFCKFSMGLEKLGLMT